MSKCYILQTPANWFFRRSVPADLRDKLGRREIKVTLQTGSKQAAIKLARALVVETDTLFNTMRGISMSSKRINIPGLTEMVVESQITSDGAFCRKLDMSAQDLMALAQVSNADPVIADRLLKQIESILQPPGSHTAPYQMSAAQVQAPSPPMQIQSLPITTLQLTAPEEQIDCVIDHDENEVSVTSKKLSDAIREFMAFGDDMDRWKNDKITTEAETDLVLLVEILGDRLIGKVTPKMALQFRKVLTKIPKYRKTKTEYAGRSIKELINDATIPQKDLFKETYINSIISSCSGFYNWAFSGNYNPFTDLKKKERGAKHAKRDAFDEVQLLQIFSHETFTGKKPNKVYQYWSPIMALLAGMRQTEIAQLCIADICYRDGVYGINMNEDEPGHTIKTTKSRRFSPIHKDLIRLGFKERVDRLRERGEKRLFPELYLWETDPNREKSKKVYVGQTISKWFNGQGRFLDSIGITSEKLVFHSFRKNFITKMAVNGVPKENRTQIVGHEDGDTHDAYITEFNYPTLKGFVDDVDFSAAFVNIVPWNVNWG
ncbi:MAG: site-specific integrase [Desulfuromonadales bacterium]